MDNRKMITSFDNLIPSHLSSYTRQYDSGTSKVLIGSNTTDHIFNLINEDKTSELIEFLHTSSQVIQSYALIQSLYAKKNDIFKLILESFVFEPDNEYIIMKTLESYAYGGTALIKFFAEKGFNYIAHGINPFVVIIEKIEDGLLPRRSDEINLGRLRRVSPAINRIKYLADIGYDIHMNEDQAFKICFVYEILEYFIEIGTDIKTHGKEWLTNFLNQTNVKDHDIHKILNLMLHNGLHSEDNIQMIIKHASKATDADFLKILEDNGIELVKYESSILTLAFDGFDKLYSVPDTLEFLKIIHKHGCNLKLINKNFIIRIIQFHQFKSLEFLFENGVDVNYAIVEPHLDNDFYDSRLETFKTLVKNGIDPEKALWYL